MKKFQNGIIAAIRAEYGILADTDSYKFSHPSQFPAGTKQMVSYIESRGGKFDHVVWVGIQAIIMDQLLCPVTRNQIENILSFVSAHFMGNVDPKLRPALEAIVDDYNGMIPVRIRAAKEGLVIPVKNVLAVVETTVEDERVYPITSYIEALLMRVWSPTTVATESKHIRDTIFEYLSYTSDDPESEINFKLHDFGSRGASSQMTSALAGFGHLCLFDGSDNVIATLVTKMAYQTDTAVNDYTRCPSFSIPASEHSTTTAHGRTGEVDLVNNMFTAFAKPGSVFATVIDSFNWLHFIRNIAPQFKQRLIDSGATWVFRPDSGDAVLTPLKVIEELDKVFGHTVNGQGFKVLNNVRVIQGDGITSVEVEKILKTMCSLKNKWSASNIAFGMGGGLLQKNNRDTQKFAMKCCAINRNNEWIDVFKDPAVFDPVTWEIEQTATSFKKSKQGRLELMHNSQTGAFQTVTAEDLPDFEGKFGWSQALETVFENGELIRVMDLDEIRTLARA